MGLSVAMISTWATRCGIFTYSRSLANALAQLGVDIYIVRWPRFGFRSPELIESMVLDKIPIDKVDIIHHQNEYGLLTPNLEGAFYSRLKQLAKPLVVTMHAVGNYAVDKLVGDVSNKVICLTPETKIFVNDGICPIKDISIGVKVLTHKGRFANVTKVFKRNYNGEIFEIYTWYSSEPLRITPNHPVLAIKREWCNIRQGFCRPTCKFIESHRCRPKFKDYAVEWVPAKELREGDVVTFPMYNYVSDLEEIRVNDFVKIDRKRLKWDKNLEEIKVANSFLRLMGYYIAEGCAYKNHLQFSFSVDERQYVDDVVECMKDVFATEHHHLQKFENYFQIIFSNKLAAELFKKWCGHYAREKQIPDWVLHLPKEKQSELIKGIWRGDGSFGEVDYNITTFSETLAHQLRLILARFGIISAVNTWIDKRTNPPSKVFFVKTSAQIKDMNRVLNEGHFHTPKKDSMGWTDGNYLYIPIRKIFRKQYNGVVFNLETNDGSYTTHNMIVHNCHNEFCARHFQGDPQKVVIIPHGCEPKECPPMDECKRALGIDPRIPIVGYQGFISPPKGVEQLVQAMQGVPNAALLIGGGWFVGEETDYIMRLKQWSLEVLKGRCQWLGYIPDERLPLVYGSMSCLVYPSRWASESGALLTGLSHGKAVIASSVPPFKEKEKLGALMTFKGVEDLKRKIKRVLRDEALRRSLEEGAKAYSASVSWPRVASKHLSLYQHILNVES